MPIMGVLATDELCIALYFENTSLEVVTVGLFLELEVCFSLKCFSSFLFLEIFLPFLS